MKKLLRKILLELDRSSIPNPVHGVSGSNRISSPFGMRIHPVDGKEKMHTGIDISVECGTPLKAPANGTVIVAEFKEDACGGRVKINHGNYFTLYCHLKKIEVSVNEKVFQGEKIGEVGGGKGEPGAGSSTGCHLHMEVQNAQGVPQNPEDFVNLQKSPKPTSSETIKQGASGEQIKTLKCFLKHTTYGGFQLGNEKDTDEIGPKTVEAIKRLQDDLGVTASGEITAEMIPLIKDKIQDMNAGTKKLIQNCYSSS
jgi:hypothetical protein